MEHQPIPQVTNAPDLARLLEDGYILHEPKKSYHYKCELTLAMNPKVYFMCPIALWTVMHELLTLFDFNPENQFVLVQLQQPGTDVEWCIVNKSNASALRWKIEPENKL